MNSNVSLGTEKPHIPFSACWSPGPANGYDPVAKDLVEVGDKLLVLVHCVDSRTKTGDYWDSAVIVATECGWDDSNGDSWGAWDWEDVSWFLPLTREILPQL